MMLITAGVFYSLNWWSPTQTGISTVERAFIAPFLFYNIYFSDLALIIYIIAAIPYVESK